MHDFPPPLTTFTPGSVQAPDTRSPMRFLLWVVRQQTDLVVAAVALSVAWMLPAALTPWVFGRAIDTGIVGGDARGVVGWVGLLLVVTVVAATSGVIYHTVVVRSWLVAAYGTTSMITNKTVQLGHVTTRRNPTGEVLSVSGSDGDQFGGFIEVITRALGNLVAYVVVAVIVLRSSLLLGLVVLLVAPLLVVASAVSGSSAAAMPPSRSECAGRACRPAGGSRWPKPLACCCPGCSSCCSWCSGSVRSVPVG